MTAPAGPERTAAIGAGLSSDLVQRILLSLSLLLLVGLSWVYLAAMAAPTAVAATSGSAHAHHGAGAATAAAPAAFLWSLAMWATMAVAMMLPTSVPLLFLFGRYWRAQHPGGNALPATSLLVTGYLGVWLAFAVVASGLQWWLERSELLSAGAGRVTSPVLAGAVLTVAGIYQLTPLKTACLSRCRSPLMFLNTRWRQGRLGPLAMGLDDGFYCLGCCWALMLVMFVTGVMSLLWMAALTGLMVAEKLVPRGLLLARVSGTVLIAIGVWSALS